MLNIGQVAKQTQTSVETLRYYEREGLIQPQRSANNGYRQYTEDMVRRVHFIKRGKALGFTLKEIGELMALQVSPRANCRDVKSRAQDKIQDIEQRLVSLTRMKQVLGQLIASCDSSNPITDCPILEALNPNDNTD